MAKETRKHSSRTAKRHARRRARDARTPPPQDLEIANAAAARSPSTARQIALPDRQPASAMARPRHFASASGARELMPSPPPRVTLPPP
eukprot:915227-Pleurochrysis_carterae.AAC.1